MSHYPPHAQMANTNSYSQIEFLRLRQTPSPTADAQYDPNNHINVQQSTGMKSNYGTSSMDQVSKSGNPTSPSRSAFHASPHAKWTSSNTKQNSMNRESIITQPNLHQEPPNHSRDFETDLLASMSNSDRRTGRWTAEENELIKKAVEIYGEDHWDEVASVVKTRNAIQCRSRWQNYLSDNIDSSELTLEEIQILTKIIPKYTENRKKKWKSIAEHFPGRNAIKLKNGWKRYETMKKNELKSKLISNSGASSNNSSILSSQISSSSSASTPNFVPSSIRSSSSASILASSSTISRNNSKTNNIQTTMLTTTADSPLIPKEIVLVKKEFFESEANASGDVEPTFQNDGELIDNCNQDLNDLIETPVKNSNNNPPNHSYNSNQLNLSTQKPPRSPKTWYRTPNRRLSSGSFSCSTPPKGGSGGVYLGINDIFSSPAPKLDHSFFGSPYHSKTKLQDHFRPSASTSGHVGASGVHHLDKSVGDWADLHSSVILSEWNGSCDPHHTSNMNSSTSENIEWGWN